jgi:hypothetical protein
MPELQDLRLGQRGQWWEIVRNAAGHDFHHMPFYHSLAEDAGEGEAHLYVYEDDGDFIALPLLLRSLGEPPCHSDGGDGWYHATSVYGYTGPLMSRDDLPADFLVRFQRALRDHLADANVISVFSRLHPCLPQPRVIDGIGEIVPCGQTISVDLTLPPDVQRMHYRATHKRHINRLTRLGAVCEIDTDGIYLDTFADIHAETMRRVGADEQYYLERSYFERFFTTPQTKAWMSVVHMDGDVMAAGLFTSSGDIIQAHLNGTRDRYLHLSPAKLMYDGARLWANDTGAKVMHIGGGVGSGEDSLFHFKQGFSRQRHQFSLWKWVLRQTVVHSLAREKERYRAQTGRLASTNGFFPQYLCPSCPCEEVPSYRFYQIHAYR